MVRLDKRLQRMKGMGKAIGEANFEFANVINESLKRQFISQRKRAARKPTAQRFRAVKVSKFRSEVRIPQSSAHLDSMMPHYVSLKRGRRITQWAQKYYSPMTTFSKGTGSNHSLVRRNASGMITGGSLYVHPDPFIRKGLNRVRNKHRSILQRHVKKVIAG